MQQVLKEHNEQMGKRTRIRPRGVDPERAAVRDEEIFGLILDEGSQFLLISVTWWLTAE